ncbi:MAG: hypothetical protein WCF65_02190 [Parachlamydiaceae bacterium]
MREQHQTPSRLNFEFPEEARKHLKIQAIKLGISVRELATQAILEKLETLELQADTEAAECAWKRHLASGSKTISHEEMMKKVGWDEL